MRPNHRFAGEGEQCSPLPEPPQLGLFLVFLGHRLSYLIDRRLAPYELNRTQAMIIMALRRNPGLMALDLAGPLWVEPPSVTRAVQSMERRGLISRQPHPTDRRASLFYLTRAGESSALAIDSVARQVNEDIEVALTDEERDSLGTMLGVLASRIEALWTDGPPERAIPDDQMADGVGTPLKGTQL